MSTRTVPKISACAIAVVAAVALLAQQASAGTTPPTATEAAGSATAAAIAAARVDTSGPYGSIRLTGSSAVALTFDDGPDRVVTPKLLDLLKKHGVKATFCVVGHRARDNPSIIKRMVAEGHTLCNHSWQHLQDLGLRDEAAIRKDLAATTTWIRRAAPGVQVQYFRAPYGNFTPRLNKIASEMGLKLLSWSIDDDAWKSQQYGKGDKIVAHMISVVKANTRNGSIILSHEMAKPWTVTAYQSLLPWLTARYKLVAMPIVITVPPRAFPTRPSTPKPVPSPPKPAPSTPKPAPSTPPSSTPPPPPSTSPPVPSQSSTVPSEPVS